VNDGWLDAASGGGQCARTALIGGILLTLTCTARRRTLAQCKGFG
jgi:hypothetical protein